MRATNTQSLTDGELFSIIEHGIRLTGMPAWGNARRRARQLGVGAFRSASAEADTGGD